MKQSTKLLSLVLALVMAFSCMAVIGNALKSEVQKDVMNYDAVDDAIISADFSFLNASTKWLIVFS